MSSSRRLRLLGTGEMSALTSGRKIYSAAVCKFIAFFTGSGNKADCNSRCNSGRNGGLLGTQGFRSVDMFILGQV